MKGKYYRFIFILLASFFLLASLFLEQEIRKIILVSAVTIMIVALILRVQFIASYRDDVKMIQMLNPIQLFRFQIIAFLNDDYIASQKQS